MNSPKKNIVQPVDWWAAFQSAAEKEKVSLSQWVGSACVAKLPKKAQAKLSVRPPANRPKK